MFCSSCGKPMDVVHLRCPACRRCTPAFWLNFFSLLSLILAVAANYLCERYVIPTMANLWAGMGRALWLPVRVYLTLWRDAVAAAPWVLVVLVLLLLVLRWKKKRLPDWARSGVALSAVAWLFLLFTLAGIGLTFAQSVDGAWFAFSSLGHRIADDNERMAVQALRRLQAQEATYRQKNPKLGYTCKLADLRPPAPSPASGYRLASNGDLYEPGGFYYLYSFSFSGCSGAPSATYRIDAVRAGGFFRAHSFCTDQTGEIRAERFGERDCMKKGIPVLPEE